jgi:AbrB family looped-hinge helix DNA binding protein
LINYLVVAQRGVETTIDKAGRVVIPKELRDAIGLTPGRVDIWVEGASLSIEVPTSAHVVRKKGRLVVTSPPGTPPLTDEEVRRIRDADRK